MQRLIALTLLGVLAGCRWDVPPTGPTTVTQTVTVTTNTPAPGTPTPTPGTPTPGTPSPGTAYRTPDPAAGSFLPLPTYGPQIVNSVTVDVAAHCFDFGYIDAVVDQLRARDTRWGYACRDTGCTTGSADKLAYHATAGPEVAGALGNWVVDIIGSACEAPARQWLVEGYQSTAAWTGRGRF